MQWIPYFFVILNTLFLNLSGTIQSIINTTQAITSTTTSIQISTPMPTTGTCPEYGNATTNAGENNSYLSMTNLIIATLKTKTLPQLTKSTLFSATTSNGGISTQTEDTLSYVSSSIITSTLSSSVVSDPKRYATTSIYFLMIQ